MNRSSALLARLGLVAGLGGGLAALAPATAAHACSCLPWLDILAPADGDVMPVNGLLVVDAGCGGDPSGLDVFVDGQSASVIAETNRMVGLGYRIWPEPAEGALVELLSCPGFDSCDDAREALDGEDPEQALALSFTVGPRDVTAPAAPVVDGLDYLVEDVTTGCSWPDEVRPAREWALSIDGQAEEPVLYHVTVGRTNDDEPTRTRELVLDGEEDLDVTLLRFAEDAGHDVCATVRTFDLTGNEADSVRTCTTLGRRETLEDSGCACSASGGQGGLPGAALLLLLGGWARRRRARVG